MSTPPRLVRLKCPKCASDHWVIDFDFPGEGTTEFDPAYEERIYACPHCGFEGAGYQVQQQSPPEFFLQPHLMYPMRKKEFEKWVAILREHFPDHAMLADYGKTWKPGRW